MTSVYEFRHDMPQIETQTVISLDPRFSDVIAFCFRGSLRPVSFFIGSILHPLVILVMCIWSLHIFMDCVMGMQIIGDRAKFISVENESLDWAKGLIMVGGPVVVRHYCIK